MKKCNVITTKNDETATTAETLVFGNDVKGMIQFVEEERELDEVHLKFGIYSGRSFLKVFLSIQCLHELELANVEDQQKYTEGVVARELKDSGIKKLLLLYIVAHTHKK